MNEGWLRVPDQDLTRSAWEELRFVYDPELGLNVVDLGLVYRLQVASGEVEVDMTLTTPGCPMGETMPEAVRQALFMLPGVKEVHLRLVWEPRWEPEMMSDAARRELGWF